MEPVRILNEQIQDIVFDNNMPDIKFLVASSKYGLLLVEKNKAKTLVSSSITYGLTADKYDHWWLFCRNSNVGEIYSFKIEDGNATELRKRVSDISKGIHQIDFVGDDLYVPDPRLNRLLVFKDAADMLDYSSYKDAEWYYPVGEIKEEDYKADPNFKNFNSVYSYDDRIYIVAHNYSYHSGRYSQICELDKENKLLSTIDTDARCAHNYYRDENLSLVCDSFTGRLLNHNQPVLHTDKFIRGISISDDYYILGGTGKAFDGKRRIMTDSDIYILDKNFNIISTLVVPGGQIRDIRRYDGKEYSLSNTVN